MKHRLFLLSSLLVLSCLLAWGNYTSYDLLTTKEGLANNSIHCLLKSADGFLWASTDVGISRYDGQHFRNFRFENRPQSIRNIQQTDNGLFILTNADGRLFAFDTRLEIAIDLQCKHTLNCIPHALPLVVNGHTLYIPTPNGLKAYCLFYRPQERKALLEELSTPLTNGRYSLLCKDNNNLLYALQEEKQQLVQYNPSSGKTQSYNLSALYQQAPQKRTNKIYVHNHCLWMVKEWAGILCYNLHTKAFRSLESASNLPPAFTLKESQVKEIIACNDRCYYLSTWSGSYQINFQQSPAEGTFSLNQLPRKNEQQNQLLESRTIGLCYDTDLQTLWIGTFGGGIIQYNLHNRFYNQIYLDNDIQINTLVEDEQGYLWLATNKSGILRSEQPLLSNNTTFLPWRKAGNPQGKYTAYKDPNHQLWFGDDLGNFLCINPRTGKSTTYRMPEKYASRINRFYLDQGNKLWIAAQKGVVLFNIPKNSYQGFCPDGLQGRGITAILKDSANNFWIGTEKGVMQMQLEKGKALFTGGYEQQAGLKPSTVYYLAINKEQEVIASYADKVIRINTRGKSKVKDAFTLQNGLSSGHIYCMVYDRTGNVWMGSNSGIMTAKSGGKSFYNYSQTGNNNSACLLHDGRLAWSNSWGVMFFHPEAAKEELTGSPLFISEVAVDYHLVQTHEEVNGEVILPRTPHTMKEFTFGADNNNFTLYLTNLKYAPVYQKIAYRLLPDMKRWVVTTLEQGIHFNQLPCGTHTLQIRPVSRNESQDKIQEFIIHIHPPLMETYWMRALMLMLFALALYAIARYRKNKRKKKALLQKKENEWKETLFQLQAANQKEKEANRLKAELFTSVAHELETPLALIVAPLHELENNPCLPAEAANRVKIISRSSRQMQNTCNQLLNISKQSANSLPLGKSRCENDKGMACSQTILLPEEKTKKQTARKKLLLVEDNESIQLYLKILLESEYQIVQARNGQEGIEAALKEIPDIVLCDVMMPIKDGFACCREIKEDLTTCHIPVIMLTAKVSDNEIITGAEMGCDDYLAKPFNPEVLKSKLRTQIRNRMLLKESYLKQLMLADAKEGEAASGSTAPAAEAKKRPEKDEFLERLFLIIQQNLQDPEFNVKKLADAVNMSTATLYRKVRLSTDLTTIEMIRGVRLKKAATLLKQQQHTVQEVAEMVGYNDLPSFRKHFIDFYGIVPSCYAKE